MTEERDPHGIDIGDPDRYRAQLAASQALLGAALVEARVVEGSRYDQQRLRELLAGFAKSDSWPPPLESGVTAGDAREFMQFATTVLWLGKAASIANSSDVARALQGALVSGDARKFFSTLLEIKTAVYWELNVARGAEFGPNEGHPDVWLPVEGPIGVLRLPVECKRIQPNGDAEEDMDELAQLVDAHLQRFDGQGHPLKVTIWARGQVGNPNAAAQATLPILDRQHGELVAEPHPPRWVTGTNGGGTFQVSSTLLDNEGRFQTPGFTVADIEPVGALTVRSELRARADGSMECRIKSVVSIRSDATANRIGGLASLLHNAIDQLAKAQPYGAISIGLRPPRDIGDIFEADTIVRAILAEPSSASVAFVVLFWDDESRVETGKKPPVGVSGIAVRQERHWRPYFIENPACHVRMTGLDSREAVIGALPEVIVRDPFSGALSALSSDLVGRLERGEDVPATVRDAVPADAVFDEESGSATINFTLGAPFPTDVARTVVGHIRAGCRLFRVYLEPEMYVRAVELREAIVVRVATVDLRAWKGNTDFEFCLMWSPDSLILAAVLPDRMRYVSAPGTAVHPPPKA